MLIEDKPDLMRELASALSNDTFIVTEASNYYEALRKMDEISPDLVILDGELPFVNGWQACRQIIRDFGIPVILMGKDRNVHVWRKALEVGTEFYMKIPVGRLELEARIKAILRRYDKKRIIAGISY
ncbi:response regulator transcription factor [Chloroflexota bacterium]